jgi:U2 small nuclear ribonucleoprotein B''
VSRRENPLRKKRLAQKHGAFFSVTPSGSIMIPLTPVSRVSIHTAAETGVAATPAAAAAGAASATAPQQRRVVEMPDEYLPPNKILFVQNLPEDTTKPSLEALFRLYPNLIEVRTIPGRKNIAFVEFADEPSSAVAKEALHNTRFSGTAGAVPATSEEGNKIKVTFAKRG